MAIGRIHFPNASTLEITGEGGLRLSFAPGIEADEPPAFANEHQMHKNAEDATRFHGKFFHPDFKELQDAHVLNILQRQRILAIDKAIGFLQEARKDLL